MRRAYSWIQKQILVARVREFVNIAERVSTLKRGVGFLYLEKNLKNWEGATICHDEDDMRLNILMNLMKSLCA